MTGDRTGFVREIKGDIGYNTMRNCGKAEVMHCLKLEGYCQSGIYHCSAKRKNAVYALVLFLLVRENAKVFFNASILAIFN